MHFRIARALLLTTLGLSGLGSAHAGAYKCLDSDGSVTYSQQPCEETQTTAKVINTGSSSARDQDCRLARNFAADTASKMRLGAESHDVFALYGGLDAMHPSSIAIVNYVYTHRDSLETTAQRITGLSSARCQSGSFGPVDCSVFPLEFINRFGGCNFAAQAVVDVVPTEETSADAASGMLQVDTADAPQAPTGTALQLDDASLACRARILDEINSIQANMNGGLTPTQLEQLREVLRDKQVQLDGC